MKLKPILFSTPMILALLAGTKTQTRRLIKPQPIDDTENSGYVFSGDHESMYKNDMHHTPWQERYTVHSKYEVGDVLWVRETWAAHFMWNGVKPSKITWDGRNCLFYRADGENPDAATCDCKNHQRGEWRPSLFMPKEACRLFLELVSIRVERLQDISEADAIAEGVYCYSLDDPTQTDYKNYLHKGDDDWGLPTAKKSYETLWNSINGSGSWEANPFVWVYEFKQVPKPALS